MYQIFEGLVCKIVNKIAGLDANDPFCWQPAALRAFCKASEAFLTCKFISQLRLIPYVLLL